MPDDLLQQLDGLAATHGLAFPGGDALRARLLAAATPNAVALPIAQAIRNDWLKGKPDAPPELHQALLDSLAPVWGGLDDAARLKSGLYPIWVQAQGELGHTDAAIELVQRLPALLGQPGGDPLLPALLRIYRRNPTLPHALPLLQQAALRWNASRPWTGEYLRALSVMARHADTLPLLRAIAAAVNTLLVLLPSRGADEMPTPPLLRELCQAATRALHLDAMPLIVDAICASEPAPPLLPPLTTLLTIAGQFAPPPVCAAALEQAHRWLPRHPLVQLERAKLAHAQGASADDAVAMLDGVDPADPGYANAMSWLGRRLFHGGDEALAMTYFARAGEHGELQEGDRRRQQHMQVRQRTDAKAADTGLDDADTLDPDDWGEHAALLPELIPLLAPPLHGAGIDALALQAALAAAHAAFAQRVAEADATTLSVRSALQLARRIEQHAFAAYRAPAAWSQGFPIDFDQRYGRLDVQRCRLLIDAMLMHVETLCDATWARDPLLTGAPTGASLRLAIELLQRQTDARLYRNAAAAATNALPVYQQRCGPLARHALLVLRERCALHTGDLAEARALRAQMTDDAGAYIWPMHNWAEWLALQQLTAQPLVADPAQDGHFDAVQPDGTVLHQPHRTVPVALEWVAPPVVQVRNSYLLLADNAGILLPHRWHLSMGDYPYRHPSVCNRGAAAASLYTPQQLETVDEPLWVLANMDVIVHRNYYHWMVLLLARIEWLRAHGLLEGRRLLLPQELSGWMLSSLADIGVAPEQWRSYSQHDNLLLTNARVLSPLEFAGQTLVTQLQQTLWRRAGLDPSAPPPQDRLLYISRRGAVRRPLVEEEAVTGMATSLGFEAVAPETLSLLDQVRLFASARGIAGPPGAAYTNLMWAGPGTRVLSIFKEEVTLPPFVDLSVLRGQQHRWLLGRNLPGFESSMTVNAPYTIDLGLAQRELLWAAGRAS